MNIWITGASSGIGEACAYRYATQSSTSQYQSPSVQRARPYGSKHS